MMKTNKSLPNRRIQSESLTSIYQIQNQQLRATELKGNSVLLNADKHFMPPKKSCLNNYIFDGQLLKQTKQSKRIKTEGDQKNEHLIISQIFSNFQQCKNSKLYHPSIYHQWETRKRYFCNVIDSYVHKRNLNASQNNYIVKKGSIQGKLQSNKIKTVSPSRRPGTAYHANNNNPPIMAATKFQFTHSNIMNHDQYERQALNSRKNKGWTKKINTKKKYLNKTIFSHNVSDFSYNQSKQLKISSESQQNSFSDENNEFEAYFQTIDNNAKPIATNKLHQNLHGNIKGRLIHSIQLQQDQLNNQFIQQLLERLKLLTTNINISKDDIEMIGVQQMYNLFLLKVSPSTSLPKFCKNKLVIKQYKQDFKSKHMTNVNDKVKQFGVSNLWNSLPKYKNPKLNCSQLFYSPYAKSLRQQFFSFKVNEKSEKDTVAYVVHTTSSYNKLFQNNCEYFKDIIIALAEDLTKMRGNVINNNFTMDNIFRLQQKCIKIGDWGCSAICRRILVAGKNVAFKDEPILTASQDTITDNNLKQPHWLIQPECLPPQIVKCLSEGRYESIWDLEDCPQVWTLGILIFQLLTVIPVWFPFPVAIGNKAPRLGYFYDSSKRLKCIYEHQKKMGTIVSRWFRDQKNSNFYNAINPQILHLMKQMLQTNSKLRPSPQEIIRRLKQA